MAWTPVAKPVGTNYTNVNPAGKSQYDQSDIAYDDSSIFYDGVNLSAWIGIAKPVGQGYGEYQWQQMVFQWQNASQDWSNDDWTKVNKPI